MRVLVGFLLGAMWLTGREGIPLDEYRARRDRLREALPGAVIVLVGATESESGSLRSGFFQEANFLYLSGWREPGAAMLLAPGQDILFLPDRSERRERYTGAKLAAGDPGAVERTGFSTVLSLAQLEPRLRDAAAASAPVFTLLKAPGF